MDLFKTDAVEQLLPLRFVSAISRPTVLFGFACAFLFFQLLIWTVRYSRKNTKPLANIPGPSGWPIIGIGLDLPARPRQLLNRWAAQYGDTFKVRVGWYNWVFFNSPDAVKEVFDRQAAVTSGKPPLPIAQEFCLRGEGVLLMTYSTKWKQLHAFLKQLLNAKASAAFIPSQEFEIKQLLWDLSHEANSEGRNSTDFYKHIRRMTFSIVMTSAYGLRIPKWDCQEVHDVYGNMRMLSIILSPGVFWIDVFPLLNWLPRFLFPSWPKAKFMAEKMHGNKMRHWNNLKERIVAGNAPECFAKDLMKSNYREYGLEEESISWLASAVPEAGAETTASALNGMIRYLAMFPEAQARAYEEVTRVLADGRMATLADEPQIPYIRAVIKETLRLCPVATTGLRRMADGDVHYRDHQIAKGTILLANLNALHWDQERLPDPFSFKPERYLNHPQRSAVYAAGGDIFARHHITSGAGRRICSGIHLAENGLFLAVSNIIWAYEFRLPLDNKGNEVPLDTSDEGFMEGPIRVPKEYSVRILERAAARSDLIRQQWKEAQKDGYVLRGVHVDVDGGVRGASKKVE